MGLQKIFFSYSRTDASDFVLKLATDLKKVGFNVWVDQQDIRAGSEWDLEIEKALETCDCLLFVETEKSVTSNNVLDEVYYALEQHKKVIPLILRDSKTPFRLQRLQHIDFTKDHNAGLTHLISELKSNTNGEVLQPEQEKLLPQVDKPFYTKHSRLILIITLLVIMIAAAIIYTSINKKTLQGTNDTMVNSNDKIISSNDTTTNDRGLVNVEPDPTSKNDIGPTEKTDAREEKIQSRTNEANKSGSKKAGQTNNKIENETDNKTANLNETFAGDWQLIAVEPKAQSTKGYLKIEAIDDKKVTIKSYFQFYYFKTNETSFLSVFNGFAGCTSCILEREMKITPEDIAVGSQTYKILKEDQPAGGKAGDTIMNAGANKSILASVTLHLINNKTAVIKVQRSVPAELSYGLMLEPFVYSFRFRKTEY